MTTYITQPVPPTRTEWLASRRRGIGGSDVAPLLGLSPWTSPYSLWEDKTGRSDEKPATPAIYWGNMLEPVIRQAYADATGHIVTKPDVMYVSKEHPFMLANIDGIREDGRLLEIKTTSSSEGWGAQGTDEIPDYYLTQVQHYLAVTGAPGCDVAVLISGRDFRIYEVEADAELQATIIEREKEFWHLVETKTPPEAKTIDDMQRKWRDANAKKMVQADGAAIQAFSALCQVQRDMSALKRREADLKAQIMGFMGNAVSLEQDGKTLATWTLPSSRKTIDAVKLKTEFPKAYEECLKTNAPVRTFRIYPPKEVA